MVSRDSHHYISNPVNHLSGDRHQKLFAGGMLGVRFRTARWLGHDVIWPKTRCEWPNY
jgi:hypothetical protein